MKIAVLDDYQKVALTLGDWSALQQRGEVTVFDRHLGSVDQVAAALAEFEVVCVMRERTPFPRALFEKLPKLKLLVTTGMRNLSIDLAAAAERGVTVCGTGSLGHATAELTWGLILALYRHIPEEHENMRGGRWQTTLGRTLWGKTLGVLGLGKLGSEVANVGRAFGMEVIAWSQNLTVEAAKAAGATRVEKDELLARADVVTIHLVLSDRTRGLLGAREFGLMKASSVLVNTSRGPIVEEKALLTALAERQISGAGIDVYDSEPLPADHPLRRAGNVVTTPHLGYVTEEGYAVFFRDMVESVTAYLDGAPVRVMKA